MRVIFFIVLINALFLMIAQPNKAGYYFISLLPFWFIFSVYGFQYYRCRNSIILLICLVQLSAFGLYCFNGSLRGEYEEI